MPTQLPRESTDFFGDLVLPYVFDILQSDANKPLEEHDFHPSVYKVSAHIIFQEIQHMAKKIKSNLKYVTYCYNK